MDVKRLYSIVDHTLFLYPNHYIMAHLESSYSQFFRDLAANNNRDWFHANKKRYESDVKIPFYELVAELISEIGKHDPELNLEVKNAVFRIHRDIRFSKDKTPYKLQMSAIVSRGGRKRMNIPGIYIQIEAEKMMIAGGCYRPDKDDLQRIREHIIANPKRVEALLKDKKFRKFFPDGIVGDRNKRLPKDIQPYSEDIPLLYQKQYFFYADHEGEDAVTRKDIISFIVKHYKAAEDWMNFLLEAITD